MENQRLHFGPFVLDLGRKVLTRNGAALSPGQRGMALLERLALSGGKPVSKDDLLQAAWPGLAVEESNLTVQIAALRKLLGTAPDGGEWIATVQRLGYQLNLPLTEPAPAAESSSEAPPSIAVLPFDNMSVDPAEAFFADGITEDITTALCRLKGFLVIARNTMFTYKGKPVNIQKLGQELGVRYLLEGSVRSAGGRIRVSALLIDARTGNQIWAERYDREVTDLFRIQDEITSNVASRIGSELMIAEHERAARKPPGNLDAWECFVRGMFLGSRMSKEDSAQALDLLERAIAHDPAYAQALGLMAWIVAWRGVQGWDDLGSAIDRTRSLAARATAAEENEPWAWIGQGCVGLAGRDTSLAHMAFERAVDLNPNFAMGHGMLSLAHSFGGRGQDAIARLNMTGRLSPREVFQGAFAQQYAFAHFQAGDYAAGLENARRAHQLRPGHVYPMVIGASSAGHLGDVAGASLVASLKAAVPHASADFVEATAPYVKAEDRARLAHGLRLAGLD